MPAPAVIPAPIAYIKVVVVKKLVVGSQSTARWSITMRVYCRGWTHYRFIVWRCSSPGVVSDRYVYFEKIRVLKAVFTRSNTVAWNNEIGLWFYFVGLRNQGND